MHHNVEVDYVGINQRQRLTCFTCGITIVQQPHLELSEWQQIVDDFCKEHPTTISEDDTYAKDATGMVWEFIGTQKKNDYWANRY